MGNYDVKWHAYEQGIKNQASWATLTPEQRAAQMGQYSVGLQQDEIKAAKKAKGKRYAKAIAEQRKLYKKPATFGPSTSTIKPGEGTCTAAIPTNHAAREAQLQSVFGLPPANPTFNTSYSPNQSGHYTTVIPDNHAARQADLDDVFGLPSANPTFQGGSGGNFSGHYTTVTPANHAEMQKYYDDVFGAVTPGTQYRDELARHLDGKMKVTVNTSNPVLEGMNDRYRFLEERSNYKRALGEHLHKPTTVSADIIDQRLGIGQTSPQTEFYRALEQSQNANKLGKWGKIGLIALGVAAVVGLGIWAAKKIKQNKEEKIQEQERLQQEQTQQPIQDTNLENEGTPITDNTEVLPPVVDDSTTVVPPVVDDTTTVVPPVVDETEEETTVDKTDDKEETSDIEDKTEVTSGKDGDLEIKVDGNTYKVKKGDNVWNIAKEHLRDELGREPKASEILIKTREIMKDNNLKLEDDGYVCLIYPEQELKVA